MNNVRLYGFEECPYCQELKEFYENDNINFTYVDINLDENNSFKSIKEALELTKKFLND